MFYDNLIRVCDAQNLKVTPIVAECGGAKGSISNWKNGASPNSDMVAKLAVRLNVSTDYLIFGEEKCVPPEQTVSADERELLSYFTELSPRDQGRVLERAEMLLSTSKREEIEVRSISIKNSIYKVSAGAGILLGDEEWDIINVPDTKMSRKADFSLTIKGNSMLPVYSDGDIVLVKSQNIVELGEIGIFIVNSAGYIKKLGDGELISINEEYENIPFGENDDVCCVGKVLGKA